MKLNNIDIKVLLYLNDSLYSRDGIRQDSLNTVSFFTTYDVRTNVAINIRDVILDRSFTKYDYWNEIKI